MGLFGPSLDEKIRRSAAAALPQADWRVDVDWSTGSKLHQLHGALNEAHTDEQALQYARDVWRAVAKDFRIAPDDGRDGLLDVRISTPGGAVQATGING